MRVRSLIASATSQLRHRVAKLRDRRYYAIYDRFHDLSMVPAEGFVANLALVAAAAGVHGDIVECGVWRGGMSGAMAVTLPGRHHVLLDSFEGLPDAQEIDGSAALTWQSESRSHDNCSAEETWAHEAMQRAGTGDIEIIKGWFVDTVPVWAAQHRPIAVLRLDGDWYDSTLLCLEHLFPLVAPGGLVLIDDYWAWDGCARAVHDYLSTTKSSARIATRRGITTLIRGA